MTWLSTWPIQDRPQYAEHDSEAAAEAAAEAHAKELRDSGRAHYAVAFWASGVAA